MILLQLECEAIFSDENKREENERKQKKIVFRLVKFFFSFVPFISKSDFSSLCEMQHRCKESVRVY